MATSDVNLARLVMQSLNYGFRGTRESFTAGTNGKMSEYHAAIGLADLDGFFRQRLDGARAVADGYRRRLAGAGLVNRLVVTLDISSTYVIFRCMDASEAARIQALLTSRNIGFRLWYGTDIHRHPYYANLPREKSLSVTEHIAPLLVGLPSAHDLTESQLDRVVEVLALAIKP